MIRQLVMHQHASQSNAIRRKFLVCFQFHAFFLKVSDIITYFFNRGTNNPTCVGGKCDQTNSVSPICTGGQCTQDGSTDASCFGSQCSQVNVKGSASCTWGCDQEASRIPPASVEVAAVTFWLRMEHHAPEDLARQDRTVAALMPRGAS